MSRTTKIVGFSVPPTIADEVDRIAQEEQRTKSELFREMLRVYRIYRRQRENIQDQRVRRVAEEI